jgi:hypothetical protein
METGYLGKHVFKFLFEAMDDVKKRKAEWFESSM